MPHENKRPLDVPSEAETCRKYVVPLLQAAGWDTQPHSTYRYSNDYEERVRESIVDFMHQNHRRNLELRYEDLIRKPRASIATLNGFVDTHPTVDDQTSVYRKPLYRNRRTSALNHLKAVPIYLKNYSERKDLSTP